VIRLAALLLAAHTGAAEPRRLVVVNDVADPVSLDPHREFDASSDNVVNQLFDGLVRFSENGDIQPALAESWRRVDDQTLEFKLRPGVRFHNGEPCDAEAVRFSVARQMDPKSPAPNAALLGSLEAVVVDPLTVRLKTKGTDAVLLNKLPMFVKVLPPKYLKEVGEEGFAKHPVGTGPFQFAEWKRGDRIELKRNPSYWLGGAPKVDELVFRFLPRDEQLKALLEGRVDLLTDLSGLDTLRVARNPGTKVLKFKDLYALTLLFNTRKKPFADARLRRAVVHAINKRDLIQYGAKGNGEALSGLTMPGEFGHNPDLPGYAFDRAAARRLLREAGLPTGFALRLQSREEDKDFAKIIASQLEEVGIAVDSYLVSQQRQFDELVRPKLAGGDHVWDGDIALVHYVDPTVHSYFPHSILVYSKGPYSMVKEAAFDELFLTMTSTIDLKEQERLARELEALDFRECWSLSLLQLVRPYGARARVDYKPFLTGMLDFRQAAVHD
jgi:peptide/nickel transport system substrate-binding protein